ncbi:MAG: NnrS family protein [Sulfuricellaceae bacterium]|nr:NnrS family protein [Sulfuricellaceae bacterium]
MPSSRRIWETFTSAPHRMMMLGGAIQGVLALLWWLADLLGRYGGLYAPLNWGIPPVWAHQFLMVYAFFAFFIFGFLMTTYPNWMNGEKIPRQLYVPAFLFMISGALLFYPSLLAGKTMLAVSAGLLLTGWAISLYALMRVLVRTPHPDKVHPTITTAALLIGWLGAAAWLGWLLTGNDSLIAFSRLAGIWGYLAPILLAVSHKMLPFFSSVVLDHYRVVRPYPALFFMLACALGHGALELAGALSWLWLTDIPLFAVATWFSWTWGLARCFKVKLLAVLHLSFAWFVVAMALYGWQSLNLFLTGTQVFGMAPLHTMSIGFFASMILGMASRVTLGHSGRPLALDTPSWALFLAFQLTVIVRILPDLTGMPANIFYPLAAFLWLTSYGTWFFMYAPIYWRPRVDGKPG